MTILRELKGLFNFKHKLSFWEAVGVEAHKFAGKRVIKAEAMTKIQYEYAQRVEYSSGEQLRMMQDHFSRALVAKSAKIVELESTVAELTLLIANQKRKITVKD